MGKKTTIPDNDFWEQVIRNQGEAFITSGRGKVPGKPFTYTVKGGEIFVSGKEKSITKATVMLAYARALEIQTTEGCVRGPKRLNVPGAGSYIWSLLLAFGIITKKPIEVYE